MINLTNHLKGSMLSAAMLSAVMAFAGNVVTSNGVTLDIDPSNAEPVEELSGTITVKFTDYDASGDNCLARSKKKVYLTTPGGQQVAINYNVAAAYSFDELTVELPETYTAPGTYTFSIPEGSIYQFSDYADLPEISWSYTIAGAETPGTGDVTVTPSPDQEYDTLQGTVTVTLNNYTEVVAGVRSSARLYTEDGTLFSSYNVTASGNVLTFNIHPAITMKGAYRVLIPELEDGNENEIPDVEFTYRVTGKDYVEVDYSKFTLSPSNDEELTKLEGRIELTFPNVVMIDTASGFADVTSDRGYQSGAREYRISMSETEDNVVYVNIPTPITASGTYTFSIPSSSIYIADNQQYLAPFSFIYIIKGDEQTPVIDDINVTVDPEQGEYESLHEWYVTFPDAKKVTVADDARQRDYPQLYSVNADGTLGDIAQMCMTFFAGAVEGGVEGAGTIADNAMQITTYVESVTLPGEYALVLPAGKIYLDGQAFANDIVFYYTIKADESLMFDYSWTITPDPDGAVVVNPTEFVIDFEKVSLVQNDEWAFVGPRLYYVKGGERQREYVTLSPISCTETSAILTVNTIWGISESGYYDLVVPANYLTVTSEDGEKTQFVPAIEARYYISLEPAWNGTINCRLLSDEFDLFELTFSPSVQTLERSEGAVNLLDGNYEVIATADVTVEGDLAYVEFDLPYPLTVGNYTVEVENNAFIIDGAVNNVQFFEYAFTGVKTLAADTLVDVYTMNGSVAARGVSLDSVRNLQPGIYIVRNASGKTAKIAIR